MINPESKRPVSVEDLLRIKRAERPAPEFWVEFDRELRAKQLAALVEKRPWWRRLPSFHGLVRYRLPLGATAVLAVTLFSLREYQPVSPAPSANLNEIGASKSESAGSSATPTVSVAATEETNAAAVIASNEDAATPATTLSSEATAPGELSRLVPLLSADESASVREANRPSARSIAENRAVAEAMLGTTRSGFETRALPARSAPQEPLAQLNPAETRRSRFAVAFANASLGTSPVPTARVARRLSDEQLYDSIHRFGASGNSVSFKF